MFEFFALVIAIVAFIFARKAFNQVDALRARLDAIEAAPRVATAAVAPPPPSYEAPLAPAPDIETETTLEASPPIEPASPSPASELPAATPAPQPSAGFEERIGTRWVVWVGGLTLALGGFFLVRYSIEAGLL